MTKKTNDEIVEETIEVPTGEKGDGPVPKGPSVNVPPDPWERVPLFVPRTESSKDDPNVLIGLNAVNYLIPRGVTSMVPRCVAEEYMRSQEANGKFMDKMNALAEAAAESYKSVNGK